MAQYDVYRMRDGNGIVVDCQSDLIDAFKTRFVIPLVHADQDEIPAVLVARLNPVFEISEGRMVLATQYASAIAKTALGDNIGSLAQHHVEIIGALDMLVSGF